jgi:hypothetical protein
MGCHTWFYKKIETPKFEQIRETVKDRCQREIQFLEKLISHREEIDSELLEAYPEWTPEWATSLLPLWKMIYEFANGSDIDLSIFPEYFFEEDVEKENLLENLYASWTPGLTEYVKGKGWYQEAEYHDLFRKGGYPDDRLYSLEETLAYINNLENKCSVVDWTVPKLEEFWSKYPDGMITFG